MARITIEGSVTPSTFLARGVRKTVERTAYVDKLIARGFVNVVGVTPAAVENDDTFTRTVTDESIVIDYADGPTITLRKDADTGLVLPPGKNETRPTWQAFLNEAGVPYLENDTRAELIERYDASNG